MAWVSETSPAVARAGLLLAGGLLAMGFAGSAPDRPDACALGEGPLSACGPAASFPFDQGVQAETLLFGGRIDINRALPGALEALPGIGPQRALAISTEREKRPFAGVADLVRVHGIGPKTVDALQPWVEARPVGDPKGQP